MSLVVQKNLAKLSSSKFLQEAVFKFIGGKNITSKLKTIVLLTGM